MASSPTRCRRTVNSVRTERGRTPLTTKSFSRAGAQRSSTLAVPEACPGPIDGAPGRPQRMTSTDLQGRAPIGITGAALRWMSWRATTVQAFRRRRRLSHNAARRPLRRVPNCRWARSRLQAPPRHRRHAGTETDRRLRAPRLRRGQSDAVSGRGHPRATEERCRTLQADGFGWPTTSRARDAVRARQVALRGRRSVFEFGRDLPPRVASRSSTSAVSSDELTRSRDCCDAMLRCAVGATHGLRPHSPWTCWVKSPNVLALSDESRLGPWCVCGKAGALTVVGSYSVGRSPSMPLQGDFAEAPAHKRRVGAYWLTV